ncbi:auxin efflux carrier [Paxillus ammoniavirescens]|nr:auxin efflux carrier [Paxillus ammoniavirescens]
MHVAGTPVIPVLFTIFQSIFQVFLVCLAGYILSWKGLVDKRTSKALNHINIALFTPALLFSKVAFFLTPAKLRELWMIPIFFVVLTGLSGLIANALARACRLNRSQVNFATGASMFMNSNSLPVALMQSLVSTVPLLKWGPEDSTDAMFGRSLTYLVVFSSLGMMLRWSYGVRLLSQADEQEPQSTVSELRLPGGYRDDDDSDTLTHISIERPVVATTGRLVDCEAGEAETDGNIWGEAERRGRDTVSRAHAHTHTHLPVVPDFLVDESESESEPGFESSRSPSESELGKTLGAGSSLTALSTGGESDRGIHTPAPVPLPIPSSSQSHSPARPLPSHLHSQIHTHHLRGHSRILHALAQLGRSFISLSPPLLASLAALLPALLPSIQAALNSGTMTPVRGALDAAAGCSVPLTLIVLGGWFWDGEAKGEGRKRVEKSRGLSDGDENAGRGGAGLEEGRGAESGTGAVPPLANGNGTLTSPTSSTPTPYAISPATASPVPDARYPSLLRPQSPPRNSSTASTSSMLSTFGDVLLSKIHVHPSVPRTNGGPPLSSSLSPHIGRTVVSDHDPSSMNPGKPHCMEAAKTNATLSKPHSTTASKPLAPQPPNLPGESLTVFVTLLSRMVLVPLMLMPLMVLMRRWGAGVSDDPVFITSCMLLLASPPALTLAQISQGSKTPTNLGGATLSPFERLLSRTVFWGYCVLTPPITIACVMVGLVLAGM